MTNSPPPTAKGSAGLPPTGAAAALYGFRLTCPLCGANVVHVASGTSNGVETRAVARCTGRGCRKHWVIRVILIRAQDEDDCDCSTDADYCAHLKRGETPCDASRAAHNERWRRNWRRRKEAACTP